MSKLYTFLRYFTAFVLITYGFAKLTGAQFTMLDSELDKPLRAVSGFWLTWYYFSYSPVYGTFIGAAQIAGGILLLFRKSTLLGACLMAPLVCNIVLIDLFYGIDLGGLLAAVTVGLCLYRILRFHRAELVDLFWSRQNAVFPEPLQGSGLRALRVAVRALVIAVPLLGTYYIANYNNRRPTPIDGRWKVT